MTGDPYNLVGGAGEKAKAMGLVDADWYRCEIPRATLKQLMHRSDAQAIRDTALWYVLIALAAIVFLYVYGTVWAVPAFLLYATLYAGPADSRWHEAGHGTAFKTRWMNDWLYQAASFQVMRRPTVWRWSHFRHHTDTLVTGRDREIQVRLPIRIFLIVCDFFGLTLAPAEFVQAVGNGVGWISPEVKSFIPETEWKTVIREGRIWTVIYATVIGAALYYQTWLPILLIGLPSIAGSWLYNFFGLPQHACLPENVLDHRLNSRTILMNPISRFLYWNMNYHVEHHMFPMVPYHALAQLHEVMKADCPPPYPSLWAAYREIIAALIQQWRDPAYYIRRPLPRSPMAERMQKQGVGA